MRPNSSQLAACRPSEIRTGNTNPDGVSHDQCPYQKATAVNQAYNEATEWEWITSVDPDAPDKARAYWSVDNIDSLLPEHGRLDLFQADDHIPACRSLGGLWDLDNREQGEDFTVHFLRKAIAELAMLPNPLLARTIIRLFGKQALRLTKHGRIQLQIVDWVTVHGALWPGCFRESTAERIRAAESVTELMVVG